jgi:hypothetical protein
MPFRSVMPFRSIVTATTFALVALFATTAGASVGSDWNAAALQEVRNSKSLRNGPPMVARALAIVHTCMYDAWAAYDDVAIGTALGSSLRRPHREHNDANKAEAISFAAYRCLRNLYPDGTVSDPPGSSSRVRLDAALVAQGYKLAETSNVNPKKPAGIGNVAAQAVIDFRANDGANQYGNAACPVGNVCPTVPVTIFAPVPCTEPTLLDPIKHLVHAPPEIQPIPCVGAGGAAGGPYSDYNHPASGYSNYVPRNPLMGFCNPLVVVCPDPDPYILEAAPWPNIVDLDHWQPLVFNTHARQTFVAPYFERVTPFGLRSADQFDHLRHIEPDIFGSPRAYKEAADEVLRNSAELTAEKKLIVEYWADGPESELPPGHWGIFAQFVSDRDDHSIDQDVKMFFAMHNVSFDAGIVAWHLKRKYDGVRPITAIRHLYDGKMIRAFGGPGEPVKKIHGEKWMPYNPGSNLTPPFPGYISGHSTFSAASAAVLQAFTGSDDFGFSTIIEPGFGRVEPGIPAVPTTMAFDTFSAAADAAALSRLYGGIHFSEDNTTGLKLGALIGRQAWEKAQGYFNGSAPEP